jgi:hypothetical protein
MSARRVAFAAGLVGGISWLAKVAMIWGNDGTNTDKGLVAVAFLVGAAGLMVAAAAAGAWLAAARPLWLRAAAAIAGVVTFLVVFALLDAVLSPLAEDGHWSQDEVEIVASAVLALGLAAVAWPGRARSAAAAA